MYGRCPQKHLTDLATVAYNTIAYNGVVKIGHDLFGGRGGGGGWGKQSVIYGFL